MDAGLIWIGPSPESISVLGDKRSAKEYLTKHAKSVPLIPGFSGKSQDPEVLKKEAEKIGYPVLVKASAGGGGKGMRIVRRSEDFVEELQVIFTVFMIDSREHKVKHREVSVIRTVCWRNISMVSLSLLALMKLESTLKFKSSEIHQETASRSSKENVPSNDAIKKSLKKLLRHT